jgi:hypothetical protein
MGELLPQLGYGATEVTAGSPRPATEDGRRLIDCEPVVQMESHHSALARGQRVVGAVQIDQLSVEIRRLRLICRSARSLEGATAEESASTNALADTYTGEPSRLVLIFSE